LRQCAAGFGTDDRLRSEQLRAEPAHRRARCSRSTTRSLSLQNRSPDADQSGANLASLPYSSLQQLQQSIGRTRQLAGQAQNIAYDVQQIDQAFSTTYAPASANSLARR
jgi:conjugal transfer/entry exclusion protein